MLKDETDVPFPRLTVRDVFLVGIDFAGIRDFEARENAQQRRLAGAGRTQQCAQRTGRDLQVHMVEGDEAAESFAYVLDGNAHAKLRFVGCDNLQLRSRFILRPGSHHCANPPHCAKFFKSLVQGYFRHNINQK